MFLDNSIIISFEFSTVEFLTVPITFFLYHLQFPPQYLEYLLYLQFMSLRCHH